LQDYIKYLYKPVKDLLLSKKLQKNRGKNSGKRRPERVQSINPEESRFKGFEMRIARSFKRGKGLFFIFFLSFNFALISADQKSEFKKDREARDIETKVDEYIKPYIDAGGFSGAILMAKAGKVLLSKGYGMANYELGVLNTSKTKFQIASISKTFTAAAILILEERGKLKLTDTLSSFQHGGQEYP
jgi:hypothetical protein